MRYAAAPARKMSGDSVVEDSTRVSRKLAAAKVAKERQPGAGKVWGRKTTTDRSTVNSTR